jgi:D-alanyl-lipoteichoic acid acyltransferase DltB (MBOAT superfamily)
MLIASKAWLVLASLFFYGYWNPNYLLLILSSMLVNFALGTALHRTKKNHNHKLHHQPQRKSILIGGILFNLGLLGYFKYVDFFIQNINWAFDSGVAPLELALPLAISFFTFQQIAYLVDSYQLDTQEYEFLNYCLFVTFFPQLIAGPIVHHKEMMPQFSKAKAKILNWRNISVGLFIFFIGLFKKVFIADSLAVWANAGFDTDNTLQFIEAWGTSLSYTFQLYYDFSGYSDMAIGAALMLNIKLPVNFNSPYKAQNIQDFWRRWHITLSRWLRDYVYIPLGGSRKSSVRIYINLIITFLLGGFWHGAGWTFIIWGAMHGIGMAIHRYWKNLGYRMHPFAGWMMTFLFINISWVFFRADSYVGALRILKSMAGLNGFEVSDVFVKNHKLLSYIDNILFSMTDESIYFMLLLAAKYIIVFGLISFILPNSTQMIGFTYYNGRLIFKRNIYQAIALALLIFLSVMTFTGGQPAGEFLYYNF